MQGKILISTAVTVVIGFDTVISLCNYLSKELVVIIQLDIAAIHTSLFYLIAELFTLIKCYGSTPSSVQVTQYIFQFTVFIDVSN